MRRILSLNVLSYSHSGSSIMSFLPPPSPPCDASFPRKTAWVLSNSSWNVYIWCTSEPYIIWPGFPPGASVTALLLAKVVNVPSSSSLWLLIRQQLYSQIDAAKSGILVNGFGRYWLAPDLGSPQLFATCNHDMQRLTCMLGRQTLGNAAVHNEHHSAAKMLLFTLADNAAPVLPHTGWPI